jgi:hypothetical protein
MQEEDDGPLLVVVATPLLRQVDLEAVSYAVQFDSAIEKAGFLRGLWAGRLRLGMRADRGDQGGRGRAGRGRKTAG